jgi:hypothetical protein
VERRLAVHAGALSRRPTLAAVALASLVGSLVSPGLALAKPKKHDAKAAFDRGVAAYKKNDFVGASAALGKSFDLEADVDTLFAWAQSERKLEHCDKASELYQKLLTFPLPAENKAAVDQKLEECRQIIAAQQPPPPPEPPPQPAAPPQPPPPQPMVAPGPPPDQQPQLVDTGSHHAWYRDPLSLSLVGIGVVGVAVGGVFLFEGHQKNTDFNHDSTASQAKTDAHTAKRDGTIGIVGVGAGGVLLIGGIAWIVMRHGGETPPPVTGWLGHGGGGFAFDRSF